MQHRILAVFLWIACAAAAHAQSIPAEWRRYTTDDYLFDFQREKNERGLGEAQLKKHLQEAAFAGLAKKVRMQVSDHARLEKSAVNGRSSVSYQSATDFSTDVNLALTDYKFRYDALGNEGAIIAFINKPAARMFYKNEIRQALSRVDNATETAQEYIGKGFKEKARKELEAALPEFQTTAEPLFWLNFYGTDADELGELQGECNGKEQAVKRMLADLRHGTTIYLACTADLFGKDFPTLEKELKGLLAGETDCSFTTSKDEADWVITINARTREYNTANFNGIVSYYSYADAQLSIFKTVTSQMVCEDGVSAKGGHTLGHNEAGRTAYKDLATKIINILKTNIKE